MPKTFFGKLFEPIRLQKHGNSNLMSYSLKKLRSSLQRRPIDLVYGMFIFKRYFCILPLYNRLVLTACIYFLRFLPLSLRTTVTIKEVDDNSNQKKNCKVLSQKCSLCFESCNIQSAQSHVLRASVLRI